MTSELPSFVPTSRKTAFEAGARLLERELRQLRARAMVLDGNPFGAQYKDDPVGGQAESIFLDTLHLAQCASILRESARQEST